MIIAILFIDHAAKLRNPVGDLTFVIVWCIYMYIGIEFI